MLLFISFSLLYQPNNKSAGNTVPFEKAEAESIAPFESFFNYCDTWKLLHVVAINVAKTKILVFGDRPGRNRDIVIKDKGFQTVDSFNYLGTCSLFQE